MDKTKAKEAAKDEDRPNARDDTKISPTPASPLTGNADAMSDDDQPPAGRRKDNETDANRPSDGVGDRAEEGL